VRRRFDTLSSLLAALLILGACTLGAPRPSLTIGVDLPLTGDEGRAAMPALNGIRFYLQQHPSLDGFDIVLSAKDDSVGRVPQALRGAANVQAFVNDPGVVAVIGPFDSSVARVEIPIANLASLVMVSPATSSPCLTRSIYLPATLNPAHTPVRCSDVGLPSAAELRPSGINNYFRLATTDDLQGPAAADFAFHTLHLVRVATISDHEAYGQALSGSFATRFVNLGGSVVGRMDIDPSATTDVVAYLKRMKADGVQAIYFGGVTAGKGCAIRAQMAGVFDAGEATPYLSGDGLAEDPVCVQQAGDNAAGIYATVPGIDPATTATAAPLLQAFKAVYPKAADFGPATASAYDAVAIIYAALDRAIKAAGGRKPARADVISQVAATLDFAGATGVIGFDPAGDNTHRVISVLEATGPDPRAPWRAAGAIDYTATLPY
jgi:branched-chain amino acid transport system substrate-binding protein